MGLEFVPPWHLVRYLVDFYDTLLILSMFNSMKLFVLKIRLNSAKVIQYVNKFKPAQKSGW